MAFEILFTLLLIGAFIAGYKLHNYRRKKKKEQGQGTNDGSLKYSDHNQSER